MNDTASRNLKIDGIALNVHYIRLLVHAEIVNHTENVCGGGGRSILQWPVMHLVNPLVQIKDSSTFPNKICRLIRDKVFGYHPERC